jgi:hypothetical protein
MTIIDNPKFKPLGRYCQIGFNNRTCTALKFNGKTAFCRYLSIPLTLTCGTGQPIKECKLP